MKVGVVKEFRGEYAFLSNYYYNPFTWRGIVFPTGEHAFSCAKTWYLTNGDPVVWRERILSDPAPVKAKYHGRSMAIDAKQWDANKVQYMREIVHARFQTSEQSMVGPLINTGAMMLVEGNTWNDVFWGRCNGKGFNTLGAILMEERGYWLRSEK